MDSAPPTKKKRKLNEGGRVFQEKWETVFLHSSEGKDTLFNLQ